VTSKNHKQEDIVSNLKYLKDPVDNKNMAYSMDYRKRAIEYKEEGHSFKELKEAFKIPPETYYDWKKKMVSGYYDTKSKVERSGKIDKQALKKAVEEKPDAYLRELAEPFGVSPQSVFRCLKNMGITYKKRHLPTQRNLKLTGLSISKK
jgi:transposase